MLARLCFSCYWRWGLTVLCEGLDQARVLSVVKKPRRYGSGCSEALLKDAGQYCLRQIELQVIDNPQQGTGCEKAEQSHVLKEQLKLNRSQVCESCVVGSRPSWIGGEFDLICVATFPKQSQKMMRSKLQAFCQGSVRTSSSLTRVHLNLSRREIRCVEGCSKIT